MESVHLKIVEPEQAQAAAAVIHDALPIPERLWQIINDPQNTTYEASRAGEVVAGAVVRWGEESEIEVLGVEPSKRGQGIGQAVVALLIEEARNRNVQTLFVGTSTIALDNIMFYQKCGFRMSHVRRNYFDEAFPDLHVKWRGVELHDMIVFDYAISAK